MSEKTIILFAFIGISIVMGGLITLLAHWVMGPDEEEVYLYNKRRGN